MTRAELARLFGCPPDRITKHIVEGLPVLRTGVGRGNLTTFDLGKAIQWVLQRRVGDAEKTRYFRLQADRIQQDIRARSGELVEADEVDRRWAGMVAATRERLLSLPAVVLQRGLIAPTAEDDVIALVDEALTELSARGAQ